MTAPHVGLPESALPSPAQRARLLDRPEILQAVGSEQAEAAKTAVDTAGPA